MSSVGAWPRRADPIVPPHSATFAATLYALVPFDMELSPRYPLTR